MNEKIIQGIIEAITNNAVAMERIAAALKPVVINILVELGFEFQKIGDDKT